MHKLGISEHYANVLADLNMWERIGWTKKAFFVVYVLHRKMCVTFICWRCDHFKTHSRVLYWWFSLQLNSTSFRLIWEFKLNILFKSVCSKYYLSGGLIQQLWSCVRRNMQILIWVWCTFNAKQVKLACLLHPFSTKLNQVLVHVWLWFQFNSKPPKNWHCFSMD